MGTVKVSGAVPTIPKDASVDEVQISSNLAATKAEQETGTASKAMITPNTMQYHDSVCKGWCKLNGQGTIVIIGSYNVASIGDGGAGSYTVNWDIDMSDNNYCALVSSSYNNGVAFGGWAQLRSEADDTAGTTAINIRNEALTSIDSNNVNIAIFGRISV